MKLYYQHHFNDKSIFQIPALKDNYVYMIARGESAWVFDPAESLPVEKTLKEKNLKLKGIYITHHHPDHIGGIKSLQQNWKCPVYGHSKDSHRIPLLSHPLNEGDRIQIDQMDVDILFLPGHTLGLIAYHFQKEKWLFSNDHIFSLGCGRVFEGTYEQMYASLKKVCELPDETLLMISHEYTKTNLLFCLNQFPRDQKIQSIKGNIEEKSSQNLPTVPTTLGFEKEHNPFLRWNDMEIKKSLSLESASPLEVFSEIRDRKNNS